MKKSICCILLLLSVLSCLMACNFTTNTSGDFAGEAESFSKVEEIMVALAQNNTSDAKQTIHPKSVEESDAAIVQMSNFLAGRKAVSIQQVSIHVTTSKGTAGKTKEEYVTYAATLSDGDIVYLSVVYLSDNDGDGFTSFQMVLGLV